MEDTIIYLIRHAETIDENGIRNTDETEQEINEKEILSFEGEQDSKKLSENKELKNIDIIWCSSYARAKQTAKYIVNENLNLEYKGKELTITSPCLLKLTFRKNELVNLEQIK